MPRRKTIYTWEYPYHLVSRSNNQAWFSIPIDQCWEIFCDKLNHISDVYDFKIHSFVLMSNHTHLIGTPSEEHYLGEVMNWLQSSVARTINRVSGQINHVFGGPYKPSLI